LVLNPPQISTTYLISHAPLHETQSSPLHLSDLLTEKELMKLMKFDERKQKKRIMEDSRGGQLWKKLLTKVD